MWKQCAVPGPPVPTAFESLSDPDVIEGRHDFVAYTQKLFASGSNFIPAVSKFEQLWGKPGPRDQGYKHWMKSAPFADPLHK
jgi:hypothetical protein